MNTTTKARKKLCNSCEKMRTLPDMVKNCKMPDGYLNLCKVCKRKKQSANSKLSAASIKRKRENYDGSWLGDSALYL